MEIQGLNIVSVDDTDINLFVIKELAADIGIDVICYADPQEAVDYFSEAVVDIIFVDYMMPKMNGVELIKKCKAIAPDTLFVMVTAVSDDPALKIDALQAGASEFLTKPLNAAEFQVRLKNMIELKKSQNILRNFNEELQREVERATKKLIEREYETLKVLSKAAEYKDPETGSHISRVAHYSLMLAKKVGLDEKDQDLIFHASPLHDMGKVGIEDAVLLKPGKLTAEEFDHMKEHVAIGESILRDTSNPYLNAGAIIAGMHHEKYNGSGYPKGLKGDAIHIYGRITAIADVFDALTSVRPYKKAWSFDEAVDYLKTQSGEHFDPNLVDIFIHSLDEVASIYNRFRE